MFRQNEAADSDAAMALGSHVTWWSVLQALVIVVTGCGQVWSMRTFFTEHRRMNVKGLQYSDAGLTLPHGEYYRKVPMETLTRGSTSAEITVPERVE